MARQGGASSAGEGKRLRRRGLTSAQRLSLVHRVAEALAGTESTEEVLEAVISSTQEVLGASAITVSVTSDGGTMLTTLASRGLSPESEAYLAEPAALDAHIPAWEALTGGVPLLWSSLEDRDRRYPRFAGFPSNHQSWALLPLISRGHGLGVLSLGWYRARDFTRADSALLEVIAHQCAVALDRARLLDADHHERSALELLAKGTRVMVSALGPAEVVRSLVRLAVPRLAPWCAIYVAEDGVLRQVAVEPEGHPDLAGRLRGAGVVSVDSSLPLATAYRTGELQVVPDVDGSPLRELYTADQIEAMIGPGGRPAAALVVPVQVSGRVVGVMSLVWRGWNGQLPDQMRYSAEGLAAGAGIALANVGRFQEEHQTVVTLMHALLPAEVPYVAGYEIAARYLPSGGTVAGDWFDVLRLPSGSYLIGVGDAAGHGIGTAATMALLRNAARGLAFDDLAPAGLLTCLSRLLSDCEPEGFATALYGILDPPRGGFSWSAAGHIPFIHYGPGSARLVAGNGAPPLGWLSDADDLTTEPLDLEVGEGIVMFTDGVVERRTADLEERLEVLRALVEQHRAEPAERLVDRIVDTLCVLPEDDCSVTVVKRVRPSASG